jgi:hypothetical protein
MSIGIVLRIKNVSNKICREIKRKVPCSKFFSLENHRTVYEKMMKKHGTTRQAACGNIKRRRKDAHSQNLILTAS